MIKKASEIHSIIETAWGEGKISLRRVQEICKEFNDGARTTFSRNEGSGRKKSEKRIVCKEDVMADIQENSRVTVRELAMKYDVPKTTMHDIIRKDLQLKSKLDKWVPHDLSDQHKRQRIECCEEIVNFINATRNVKRYLLVTDEKWFYEKPMYNFLTRRSWVTPDGDSLKRGRRTISGNKMMVMMALNYDGLSHFKILDKNQTVDSNVYIQFLAETMSQFDSYELRQERRAVSFENVFLQHDNARPHISQATNTYLKDKNCKLIKQSPYSPDLNLLDRMIFPLLEMRRSKITFGSKQELSDFLEENMSTLSRDVMHNAFEMFHSHCLKVVENDGDYC